MTDDKNLPPRRVQARLHSRVRRLPAADRRQRRFGLRVAGHAVARGGSLQSDVEFVLGAVMGRHLNKNLQAKKAAFLAAYGKTGTISAAAEASNVIRQMHYQWLKEDPGYPARFEEARKEACDMLEREAIRRAVKGTRRPVFHKGVVCGYVREYSDTLLIFAMKGAMPEKYRERVDHHQSGSTETIIRVVRTDDFFGPAVVAESLETPTTDS